MSSSTSTESSSGESDEEDEVDVVRPIIIRKNKKKRGESTYQLVDELAGSDEDELDSDFNSNADVSELDSTDLESESEVDVTTIRLRKLATMNIRLKRLTDVEPAESKTRRAANLARYECQSYGIKHTLAIEGQVSTN